MNRVTLANPARIPEKVGMLTGNPSSRYSAGEPGNGCPILFLGKEEKC